MRGYLLDHAEGARKSVIELLRWTSSLDIAAVQPRVISGLVDRSVLAVGLGGRFVTGLGKLDLGPAERGKLVKIGGEFVHAVGLGGGVDTAVNVLAFLGQCSKVMVCVLTVWSSAVSSADIPRRS